MHTPRPKPEHVIPNHGRHQPATQSRSCAEAGRRDRAEARRLHSLAVVALALVSLMLVTGGARAQVPRAALSLDPGFTISGTTLEIETTLENWNRQRPRNVEFFFDGVNIGRQGVAGGTNSIRFDRVELTAGTHTLAAVSGNLSSTVEFKTRPGWLSLLPPLIAIALALITRDVLMSLFLGVFGGTFLLVGDLPFISRPAAALGRTIDHFVLDALADRDHAAILIFTAMLGGMVGLLSKSGGTHGIVERLSGFATSVRRGQLATWGMGLAIFFDDYANTLIVGPTMRPITDRLRISREKLAYIVDSTAAPVVCLLPISTWVGFEIGLINDAFDKLGLGMSGYTSFLYSIPFRFYPIFAITLVGVLAFTGFDFGPMRKAERRARERGEVLAPGDVPIADYSTEAVSPPEGIPKRARNAIIPIVTVILMTIIGLWRTGSAGLERAAGTGFLAWTREVLSNADSYKALMWASLLGMLVALLLPLIQRLLSVRAAMGALVEGIKGMLMAFLVLLLAWSLGAVCGELGTANYLVGLASGVVSPVWLPALTFAVAAAISFATGTAWGTMAVLEPLVIPICHNLAVGQGIEVGGPFYISIMSATIASVLTGAVWGDHCSPISDTTILSSMASGCDHIAHVRTQLPYALTMGIFAIVIGSVPAALGVKPWFSLIFGIGLIIGGVKFIGARQTEPSAVAPAR